jgi:hypothetical protein
LSVSVLKIIEARKVFHIAGSLDILILSRDLCAGAQAMRTAMLDDDNESHVTSSNIEVLVQAVITGSPQTQVRDDRKRCTTHAHRSAPL